MSMPFYTKIKLIMSRYCFKLVLLTMRATTPRNCYTESLHLLARCWKTLFVVMCSNYVLSMFCGLLTDWKNWRSSTSYVFMQKLFVEYCLIWSIITRCWFKQMLDTSNRSWIIYTRTFWLARLETLLLLSVLSYNWLYWRLKGAHIFCRCNSITKSCTNSSGILCRLWRMKLKKITR